jgi:hypothetical protein
VSTPTGHREGIAIVIYSIKRLRLNTDGDQGDPEFEGEVKRHSNLARRKRVKQAIEGKAKQPKSHSCDERGYFRELLDALPTAVYTTDANGRITSLIRPQSSSRVAPPKSAAIVGALPGAYTGRMAGRSSFKVLAIGHSSRTLGHDVIEAAGGEDALDLWKGTGSSTC